MPPQRNGPEWARVLTLTTSETIESACGHPVRPENQKWLREVIAAELDKVAHRYNAMINLVAPNNVAADLEERARVIREGPEHYVQITFMGDPHPEITPMSTKDEAETYADGWRDKPGVEKIEVLYR